MQRLNIRTTKARTSDTTISHVCKTLYRIGVGMLVIGGMLGSPALAQDVPTDKGLDVINPEIPKPNPGPVVEAVVPDFSTCKIYRPETFPPKADFISPGCGSLGNDGQEIKGVNGILGDCQERGDKAHYYARPNLLTPSKRDKLLVFLTGVGDAVADKSQNIIHLAAKLGFHAISLSYNNTRDYTTCKAYLEPDMDSTDEAANCNAEYRDRVAFGKMGRFFTGTTKTQAVPPLPDVVTSDATLKIQIDIDDTIKMRLKDALRGLDNSDTGGGWGQYIDSSDRIQWRQIIISGWSGGAGIAHHIATKKRVHAVGLFEFPTDPFDDDGDGKTGTLPVVSDPSSGTTPGCQYWAMYYDNRTNNNNSETNDDGHAGRHKRAWLTGIGVPKKVLALPPYGDFLIDDSSDTTLSRVSTLTSVHRFRTQHGCGKDHGSLTQDSQMWNDHDDQNSACVPNTNSPNTDFFHFEAMKDMLCRM